MTPALLTAFVVSNVVALLFLLAAWRRPNLGRLLFALLFAAASQVNLRGALVTPEVYVGYADFAFVDLYRRFILGFFAAHVAWFVVPIALGQLAIAVLVSLRGAAVRLGLVGAIVFFLAIVPLGVGAAVPFPLITTLAAALLVRHRFDRTLLEEGLRRLRHRSLPGR